MMMLLWAKTFQKMINVSNPTPFWPFVRSPHITLLRYGKWCDNKGLLGIEGKYKENSVLWGFISIFVRHEHLKNNSNDDEKGKRRRKQRHYKKREGAKVCNLFQTGLKRIKARLINWINELDETRQGKMK